MEKLSSAIAELRRGLAVAEAATPTKDFWKLANVIHFQILAPFGCLLLRVSPAQLCRKQWTTFCNPTPFTPPKQNYKATTSAKILAYGSWAPQVWPATAMPRALLGLEPRVRFSLLVGTRFLVIFLGDPYPGPQHQVNTDKTIMSEMTSLQICEDTAITDRVENIFKS